MIKRIEPASRFNKTVSEFRKDRFNPDTKPVYPNDYDLPFEYSCSNCDYKVSIKNQDLERHLNSKHSNLKSDTKKMIDEFIVANQLDKFSYVDFECPKCNQSVRILFDSYPGGLSGMTYEIKHVIELKNE